MIAVFFGYIKVPDTLKQTIIDRMQRLYNWTLQEDDIFFVAGVIPGINMAARAVAHDGSILMHNPVYHPFHDIPYRSQCGKQYSELAYTDTATGFTYNIDFDNFSAAITPETRMLLLCNPHNPIGRIWKRDELQRMADLCVENDLIICSDEIHSDLIFSRGEHIPIATLSPEIAQRTITYIAPSKSYNLPGLYFSIGIIQNPDLRMKVIKAGNGIAVEDRDSEIVSFVNMMGVLAADAAYREGDAWLASVLDYIEANRDHARQYIRDNMPELKTADLEGTYLLWIDCRDANLPDLPGKWFEENGRIGLNEGKDFGAAGFVRMNLACPRALLEDGLARMQSALASRR